MAARAPCSDMAARAPCSAMASKVPRFAMAARAPCSAMAARSPCSAMASQVPRFAMAARAPCSAVGPGTGAALEASCPVLSPCPLRPPERPPPLPVGWCTMRDAPFGRGEYCQTCVPHVTCFPSSRAHIWLVPVPVLICNYQFPALCL